MNTDPDYIAASQGIRNPHQFTLLPGTWICRFASSVDPAGKPAPQGALYQSPWWISSDDFRKLLFATEHSQFNFKFYARLWLAVTTEWSAMDQLIIARVIAPVTVWAGPGKKMNDTMPNGVTFVYEGPRSLTQLYIPGMHPRSGGGANLANIVVESVNSVPPMGIKALDERQTRRPR